MNPSKNKFLGRHIYKQKYYITLHGNVKGALLENNFSSFNDCNVFVFGQRCVCAINPWQLLEASVSAARTCFMSVVALNVKLKLTKWNLCGASCACFPLFPLCSLSVPFVPLWACNKRVALAALLLARHADMIKNISQTVSEQ